MKPSTVADMMAKLPRITISSVDIVDCRCECINAIGAVFIGLGAWRFSKIQV